MPMETNTVDHAALSLVSAEQRPDLVPAFAALSAPVWPTFLDGDRAIVECWDDLYAHGLSRYQFAVVQTHEDGEERVLATSNSIPFEWANPGDDATLPDGGWDEVLRAGADAAIGGRTCNALSALSIVVSPERRGSDLAERLLRNMKTSAIAGGLRALVAPVRPTRKASYPLTSFGDYAGWTTPDGAPFDPWVRKHHQLGARIVGIASRSMTVSASLDQWTEWTGLRFPRSGAYHVEGGLAPVMADCATDLGIYEEPSIWLRHPF
ncbi:hypothetical protein [Antarcticirhabdus aurantiaca]|uniref:Uncharacterized protein n=1 Tax=Antarcticirhabdus aurantiaca TaxID=2606717 RepID=A0ACD4NTC0_9HYPH|nr:hypothetical protein [Antarcticirhabdus aurantiaca]WAJ29930.1 hypothetical protein OXU80_06870 [Jeongeuplla avenae]